MTGFGGKKGMGKLYIIISKIEKIIRLFGKYFNIETNKERISSFFIEKNRKKLIFFFVFVWFPGIFLTGLVGQG